MPSSIARPSADTQRTEKAPASPTPLEVKRTSTNNTTSSVGSRPRTSSSVSGRLRSASLKFMESSPPGGMWSATGQIASKAPTIPDIRNGSYGSRSSRRTSASESPTLHENSEPEAKNELEKAATTIPVHEPIKEEPSAPASRSQTPAFADEGSSFMTAPATPQNDSQSEADSDYRDAQEDERSSEDTIRQNERKEKEKEKLKGKPKKNPIDEMMEGGSQGDFVIGRGKMSDQTFVKGANNQAPKEAAVEADSDDDLDPKPKHKSKNMSDMLGEEAPAPTKGVHPAMDDAQPVPDAEGYYPNGYHFPEKKSTGEATKIGAKAFCRFANTPSGFLIVLYGLNVVAWGGMLFLLLCNASPAMCHLKDGSYDCNDLNSPRRIWIEIDSQILNALFCVTGFGLIPWRFRDFYFLLKWRLGRNQDALRKLAGYHRGWFRLPGSDHLPVPATLETYDKETAGGADPSNAAYPIPLKSTPDPPLTGARAPPTASWKMDFVVWAFVWNTFLQAVLSGFMWGLNRYDRPSWSTGTFVALACIVAGVGGLMQFLEGKHIKEVEGIPLDTADNLRDVEARMAAKGDGSDLEEKEIKGKEKEKTDG